MSKTLRAIGLMSGTSLDGVDVALLETDGEDIVKRGPSATYPYGEGMLALLRRALADAAQVSHRDDRVGSMTECEANITRHHVEAVQSFFSQHDLSASNIEVIGFHGQTVVHKPELRLTIQLGDGQALAKAIGIPVVYDMRAADVAAGGQGAPLVPAYHRALAKTKPAVFVNIGGVANVTFVGSDGTVLAFDTGPGNALLDDWMIKHQGVTYDAGGATALSGTVSSIHMQLAQAHPYFKQAPPKSLDRNSFSDLDFGGLSFADGAATLAALTAETIARSADWFPEVPRQWVICGGGRHNAAIMQHLQLSVPNVVPAEALGLNGDSMEAEAWAYLGVRSLKALPITFPGTTGVPEPLCGGVLAKPR